MLKSSCYVCQKQKNLIYTLKDYWRSPETPNGMTRSDVVCYECYQKVKKKVIEYKNEHLEEIKRLNKEDEPKNKIVDEEEKERQKILDKEEKERQKILDKEENEKIDKGIAEVQKKYKKQRLYEYKDEYCAIIQRIAGAEVAFIKAFSDLTSEGYRLMAQDEGGSLKLGIVDAGVNAYFYFQKIEYVTHKNS